MSFPSLKSKTADDRYDELVSEHVWPELRSRGFRRHEEDFHRLSGEAWEIVHFHKRPAENDDRAVQFTIKLASHPHRGEDVPPPLTQCVASMQLHEIAGSDRVWRDVRPRTNVRAMATDVLAELEDHGFAWLTARAAVAR